MKEIVIEYSGHYMEAIVNNMDKFIICEDDGLEIFRSIGWSMVSCVHIVALIKSITREQNKGPIKKYKCKNFNDFTNTIFENSKIPFGKLLYILINIRHESMPKLAKKLKIDRHSVERYHKRIREFLLENNENISFIVLLQTFIKFLFKSNTIKLHYKICSNLSESALQIGHLPGGCSLPHKYPQTRHL